MVRGTKAKRQVNQKNPQGQPQLTDEIEGATAENTEGGEDNMEAEATTAIRVGLQEVAKEIQDFKTEMKTEFSTLKEEIKKEMKEELDSFKIDINHRLTETTTELATQATRLAEAEQRIAELENWNLEAKEAILQSIKQQKTLQDMVTDQEGRNRRNNIRIFGVQEGAEGSSVMQFIEQLLKNELPSLANTELQIQRVHRALLPKPDADKPPRSIVVNFLQFIVKETVLKEAWKKKVTYQSRTLSFDHDYATEVIRKRKEYNGIKKILKERGIRFQTPLTRIRIHWEAGTRTYDSALEAAEELRRRGIPIELPGRSTGTTGAEERLQRALQWQQVGNPGQNTTAMRARQRLEEYRRT